MADLCSFDYAEGARVMDMRLAERVPGPAPDRQSYGSFVSFADPDGNSWFVQEVTTRLPGRVTAATYDSAGDLAESLRHAEAGHGKYEKEIGHADPDWPHWYAEYMVRERAAGGTSG
jgi:hypothetical protein